MYSPVGAFQLLVFDVAPDAVPGVDDRSRQYRCRGVLVLKNAGQSALR